ncbi:MAG TPA: restriction endonuclease subunit S [Coleofasciculaceae cyanobacterium]|jgi:type I restriction enzyme S subunit
MAFPKHQDYRDSGVDWLREVPSHWQITPLKRFFSVSSGDFLPSQNQSNGGYSVYGGNGLRGFANTFNNSGRMLLIGRVGAKCGNVHLVDGKYWVSEHALRVLPRKKFCLDFFKYLLEAIDFNRFAIRTAQPLINSEIVLVQKVAIPSYEEQERIANFLDRKTSEIDQAIAQKQRLIELLQEQKAILINQAVTKGLKPSTPMRDSGIEWLGKIPEYWQVTRLKRLFLEIDDRSTNGSEILLSLRMYAGLVPHNDVSDKPIEDTALVGYKRVYPGQIVMNRMRAAIGLFGVASIFGIVSPDYAIFCQIRDLRVDYYLNLFKTESMKQEFLLESKGLGTGSSGFLRLYSDKFGMIKVPFPPLEEQAEICNHIQEIGNQFSTALKKVEKEINLLKELKSIFISQSVTGKIKV